jgi:hypothetical protein
MHAFSTEFTSLNAAVSKNEKFATAASLEPLSLEHLKFLILHLTLYCLIFERDCSIDSEVQDYSLSFD